MLAGPTTFDAGLFEALLASNGASLGRPLTAVHETGSTNDDAFAAAKGGAPHGALFVADSQTRGRGRRGHSWMSSPGENLTFSMLLRPNLAADRVSVLSLVTGLAVREVASRRAPARISVKWPNDVVVGRRKLAGVLVESRLRGSVVDAVVVGVGINVAMRALPPEIEAVATSLALLGDPSPDREAVLAEFVASFASRLDALAASGLSALVNELREHDALARESVRVGDVQGVGDGIDETGALLIRDTEGIVHRVTSGTVERL